jgi:hypothetical protein
VGLKCADLLSYSGLQFSFISNLNDCRTEEKSSQTLVSSALIMAAESSCEMSMNFYQTAWRNIPDGWHFQGLTL